IARATCPNPTQECAASIRVKSVVSRNRGAAGDEGHGRSLRGDRASETPGAGTGIRTIVDGLSGRGIEAGKQGMSLNKMKNLSAGAAAAVLFGVLGACAPKAAAPPAYPPPNVGVVQVQQQDVKVYGDWVA